MQLKHWTMKLDEYGLVVHKELSSLVEYNIAGLLRSRSVWCPALHESLETPYIFDDLIVGLRWAELLLTAFC